MKKIGLILLYLIFLTLLGEVASRGFLTLKWGVPFFRPNEVLYYFYPQLSKIQSKPHDQKAVTVLLLGPSVMHPSWGNIEDLLQKSLEEKFQSPVQVDNLSEPTHTALDALIQYQLLDKPYDLVVIYHGLNEVRANNCPPSLFKADYSHYSWYETLRLIETLKTKYFAAPFVITYQINELLVKLHLKPMVPRTRPLKNFVTYGNDIKTGPAFRQQLTDIIQLAHQRNAAVILMSIAYYLPQNYSLEKFQAKELDYETYRSPVEIWGEPRNVIKSFEVHNQIIHQIAATSDVIFVDQNKLIPQEGKYFGDVVHLSPLGNETFVANIINTLDAGTILKKG